MVGTAKNRGVANNKNAQKFRTPQERQAVFKKYCDHIAAGYTSKLFDEGCTEKTIVSIMKNYPEDCDEELLELSRATGGLVWEKIGKLGIMGKIKGFNSSGWWRVMQNKLGWKDRMEHASDPNNPLNAGSGKGALSPEEQAVLDHFKEKLLYETTKQGGIKKGYKK